MDVGADMTADQALCVLSRCIDASDGKKADGLPSTPYIDLIIIGCAVSKSLSHRAKNINLRFDLKVSKLMEPKYIGDTINIGRVAHGSLLGTQPGR